MVKNEQTSWNSDMKKEEKIKEEIGPFIINSINLSSDSENRFTESQII